MQNIGGLVCQPEWTQLYTTCKLFIKWPQKQKIKCLECINRKIPSLYVLPSTEQDRKLTCPRRQSGTLAMLQYKG